MLSSTLSAQFLNYPETLGNLDDFGRVSTTKQISELRHITEKERQARRENTGILEMNQKYWFIERNNAGKQNQNPSSNMMFSNVTTTCKMFLKKEK